MRHVLKIDLIRTDEKLIAMIIEDSHIEHGGETSW